MIYDTTTLTKAEECANYALEHLYAALRDLNKAYNWGIADIMGGLLLVSLAKQKKMQSAENELASARMYINRLIKTMGSNRRITGLDMSTGKFLKFTDIAIDNPITDIIAQKGIELVRNNVEQAIQKVEIIQQKLREQRFLNL